MRSNASPSGNEHLAFGGGYEYVRLDIAEGFA